MSDDRTTDYLTRHSLHVTQLDTLQCKVTQIDRARLRLPLPFRSRSARDSPYIVYDRNSASRASSGLSTFDRSHATHSLRVIREYHRWPSRSTFSYVSMTQLTRPQRGNRASRQSWIPPRYRNSIFSQATPALCGRQF